MAGEIHTAAPNGSMAEQIAGFDWHCTPLGLMSAWPEPLKASVQLMLNSRFPMFVWWGPELINIYNDAYIPVLGAKHGHALGRPAQDIWHEIWDTVGQQAAVVLKEGKATWNDEMLLVMERYGYTEETYFTWSYSPILGSSGKVEGLFCACVEDTSMVVGRRRLKTLRELAAETANLRTAPEAMEAACKVLERNPHDIPFLLVYETDAEATSATLTGSAGVRDAKRNAPARTSLRPDANPWQADLLRDEPRVLERLEDFLPAVPQGPWPAPPVQALLLPLGKRGDPRPAGFMVAGLNRYTRLDEDYKGFLSLVAGHIATAIANARAYEAEKRRAEALDELNRAKTLFFSNVSHEFRTPLTLLLGPLEELRGSAAPKERPHLEAMHRNALRLLKLVNTLLDFSRIEAGRTQVRYEKTDLATFTAELASSFRSAMETAGLEYTIDCPPAGEPAWVDRDMWEKIVLNLVSNAFKFTLRGAVSVRLTQRPGTATLTVSDTGTGIAAADLPHIFDRFYRVEGARGRTHEGTGIGLALVNELVRLHGGEVKAASVPGEGSTFTVEIPVQHSDPVQAPAKPAPRSTALHAEAFVEEAGRWLLASAPSQGTGVEVLPDAAEPSIRAHVLIADDNADMRDYLARLLGTRFRVTTAANGQEAFDAASGDPPDLVLADVMMPVMDGFGLVAALRADPRLRTLPVIMLSARAGEESLIEGLDAGADDYIMKPFTARELLARVGAQLALRKERQRAHERLVEVFQQAPVGILVLRGPEYIVELANPPYQALLEGRDLVGRRFTDILPELNQDVWDAFAQVMKTGQPFIANEFHVPYDFDQDGTLEDHWFNVNYQPLREADGTISGLIAVLTEVTAQVLARRELERANSELEEFAYVASHDLQEPLRMVNIYTQLLLRRPELHADESAAQYADYVRTGVSRMEQLIKDLLLYSRVVHTDQEGVRAARLDRSLDEALSVLRMRIEEQQAMITYEPLPTVWGDERQLALVFQNVLSNSLKYSSEGVPPQVHIGVEHSDGHCTLRIRDNGIGFEPRHAERIFGLFKRLHKEAYPGTGLGLAICKRVVERYGGRISAESEGQGKGSTVSITLRTVPE